PIPLLLARQIPATVEGHAIHNVQNAMFAAAIACGLGISLENIRQGLRTFTTDFFQTPGRMNFYNEHPFRVLLDYAHNAHGMEAMAQTIRGLNVAGRRIGIIAAPGDRRDDDIRALGRASAPAFDLILLREDRDRRGRPPGAVGELLREGLLAAGFPEDRIAPEVWVEEEAVRRGLETARPGDLLVIFGDDLAQDWEQIVSFGQATPAQGAPKAAAAPPTPLFSPDTQPRSGAQAPSTPGSAPEAPGASEED
ncbi:MAG TPA: cyanophycin synthetase, partial [Thermoanaerobaculia bacterium]|nr:cyanophycin synthetase [Thermoanaerobaculia bacterium]